MWSRICPPQRERPIKIKMASLDTPQDVLRAIATVVGAVARGAITPSAGQALASLIETQRRCPYPPTAAERAGTTALSVLRALTTTLTCAVNGPS